MCGRACACVCACACVHFLRPCVNGKGSAGEGQHQSDCAPLRAHILDTPNPLPLLHPLPSPSSPHTQTHTPSPAHTCPPPPMPPHTHLKWLCPGSFSCSCRTSGFMAMPVAHTHAPNLRGETAGEMGERGGLQSCSLKKSRRKRGGQGGRGAWYKAGRVRERGDHLSCSLLLPVAPLPTSDVGRAVGPCSTSAPRRPDTRGIHTDASFPLRFPSSSPLLT